MLTQMKDGEPVATAKMAAEQARGAVDPAQSMQHLMAQVTRQGLDLSLRSLQAWADLARQLGPTAWRSPIRATMVALTYDLFEKLLAAQRQIVEELITTQRQGCVKVA